MNDATTHANNMKNNLPFFKTLAYRNLILDLTSIPYPQDNGSEWSIENRTMNDYDLFICEEGSALFSIGEQAYPMVSGKALLIPPKHTVNARKTGDAPVRMIAQHFMLYLFNKTDFFSLIKYKNCVDLPNWQFLCSVCRQIRQSVNNQANRWVPLEISTLFHVLLNAFIEEAFIEEDFRDERKSSQILRMISIIERDYADQNLLEKLMNESVFGYSHTANIFKNYTGISLKSFIIERRLEAAKDILLKGGSLRESASAAGYEDEFYFSRIFKKYTGTTPKDFRKRI